MDQRSGIALWPRVSWPINEILLLALVLRGMTDDQIAQIYRVPARLVGQRRREFGF